MTRARPERRRRAKDGGRAQPAAPAPQPQDEILDCGGTGPWEARHWCLWRSRKRFRSKRAAWTQGWPASTGR
jgi:hypothetical protein